MWKGYFLSTNVPTSVVLFFMAATMSGIEKESQNRFSVISLMLRKAGPFFYFMSILVVSISILKTVDSFY